MLHFFRRCWTIRFPPLFRFFSHFSHSSIFCVLRSYLSFPQCESDGVVCSVWWTPPTGKPPFTAHGNLFPPAARRGGAGREAVDLRDGGGEIHEGEELRPGGGTPGAPEGRNEPPKRGAHKRTQGVRGDTPPARGLRPDPAWGGGSPTLERENTFFRDTGKKEGQR